MEANQQQQHILIITHSAQSHINPALHLARRMAQTTGAQITFSTAVSAHRKMFPNLPSPNQQVDDGLITYIPFSDGYDEGFKIGVDDPATCFPQFKLVGSSSLSSIIDNLNSCGRRVTCVIYTFLVWWAVDVAIHHRIPFAQYWIQPATVFAIYYHYFHGYDTLIAEHRKDPLSIVELPGLQPMQLHNLPSLLTQPADPNSIYNFLFEFVKEAFVVIDRPWSTEKKPKVLLNTFDELEPEALRAFDNLDLIAVGPLLSSFNEENSSTSSDLDLIKSDDKGYIEWLDSKPEKSVVYISFGSLSVYKKQQMEEILKGLRASGRPYMWVVRKDSRHEGVELEDNEGNGMVVDWCSQVRVLSHPSVGCFVTHCGWNSTFESLVYGVPTIGLPQWSDQGTNIMLLEKTWGTGVKGELNEDGVLEGGELERCLDLVMGEGESGAEIRRKAEMWKEKAKEAYSEGGPSYRNLRTFVDEITQYNPDHYCH